ncbi:MAG: hypothetical protein KC646_07380 [Candidatus Cloacimonetes bacterium]|nr:hypothetical protein [Candidatus Cloacimonadota bacterium]
MKLLLFIFLNLLFVPQNYSFYEGLDTDLANRMEKVRKEKRVLSTNLLVEKHMYRKSSSDIKTYLKQNQGVLDQVLYYSLKENTLYSFTLKETKKIKFESNIDKSNRANLAESIKEVLSKRDSDWSIVDYNFSMNEKSATWGWAQHFSRGLHYITCMNSKTKKSSAFIMVFITNKDRFNLK